MNILKNNNNNIYKTQYVNPRRRKSQRNRNQLRHPGVKSVLTVAALIAICPARPCYLSY